MMALIAFAWCQVSSGWLWTALVSSGGALAGSGLAFFCALAGLCLGFLVGSGCALGGIWLAVAGSGWVSAGLWLGRGWLGLGFGGLW